MKKLSTLAVMLCVFLQVWADTRTYVLSTEESCDFKYYEVPEHHKFDVQPDVDAQGHNWTELDYDDSNWNSAAGEPLSNAIRQESGVCYFRVSFTLSEVKEDAYYFLYVWGHNMPLEPHYDYSHPLSYYGINGHFISEHRIWGLDNYFVIPHSFLKTGRNVLTVTNTLVKSEGWCVKGIFYDSKYHDVNGSIIDMPVVATDVSTMANAIYADAIESYSEKDLIVQIKLRNAHEASSYQFFVNLPWNVTIQDAILDDTRHDEHTLNNQDGRIAVISAAGGDLSGNDGNVIKLKLRVSEYIPCTLPIKITNAVYAQPNGTRVKMPNVTIPLTILEAIRGDANNDQSVTVADVVAIVNRIVGKANDSFSRHAADYNKDGLIDISDAQSALNVVLKRNN